MKAVVGRRTGQQGEDLGNDAGGAVGFSRAHRHLDATPLDRHAREQRTQAGSRHQVRAGDGRTGMSGQPHRVGIAVLDPPAFRRAEELGQRIVNLDFRGLAEKRRETHRLTLPADR